MVSLKVILELWGRAEAVLRNGVELLTLTEDIIGKKWKKLLNLTDAPSIMEVEVEGHVHFCGRFHCQKSSGMVPWVDEIRPEMVKPLDIVGLPWLIHLFNIMCMSGTVPMDWYTSVVVPILRKGDYRVCLQGFTLLLLLGKSYARELENWKDPGWLCEISSWSWNRCLPSQEYWTGNGVADMEKAYGSGILCGVMLEFGAKPSLPAIQSESFVCILGKKACAFC